MAGGAIARPLARAGEVAVLAGPGRDLMPPPQLPRDAPVVDVGHPAEKLGAPVFRHEAHLVDAGDDLLGQRLGLDEPLLGEQRRDDSAAPLASVQLARLRIALP